MRNNPLEFIKGQEELRKIYEAKLLELEQKIQDISSTDVVQLYIQLKKEIEQTDEEMKATLNAKKKEYQKECIHPMYVCFNLIHHVDHIYLEGGILSQCINCGKVKRFSVEEAGQLFDEHRLIAREDYFDTRDDRYLIYLSPEWGCYEKIRDFYLRAYDSVHVEILNEQAAQMGMSIEEYICEVTFQKFSLPKSNTKNKQKGFKRTL